MKKLISALFLLGASLTLASPFAMAQTAAAPAAAAPAAKPAAKKAAKKAPSKKAPAKKTPAAAAATAAAADNGTDEDEKEPDIAGSETVDYQCQLGDALTIYENKADAKHIALRWKKRLHRLSRVETTTGANRFENRRFGLIWIGIPAKGMLLDSKKGQQLANECKNAEQMKPQPVNADGSAPAPSTSLLGEQPAPAAPAAPAAKPKAPAKKAI